MCYLIVVFIIVCAIPVFQQGRSHGGDSWEQVTSATRRQDFPAALSMARSLVRQQPAYSYGHAWLGAIYLAMDDVTNEAEYSRAYQLFPGEEYEKDLAAVRKRMAAGASFKLQSTTTLPNNACGANSHRPFSFDQAMKCGCHYSMCESGSGGCGSA